MAFLRGDAHRSPAIPLGGAVIGLEPRQTAYHITVPKLCGNEKGRPPTVPSFNLSPRLHQQFHSPFSRSILPRAHQRRQALSVHTVHAVAAHEPDQLAEPQRPRHSLLTRQPPEPPPEKRQVQRVVEEAVRPHDPFDGLGSVLEEVPHRGQRRGTRMQHLLHQQPVFLILVVASCGEARVPIADGLHVSHQLEYEARDGEVYGAAMDNIW
mmetsp:Transcript_71357/g.190562  ORF Transcript_71357/g.190562 Transcript_71357/m.190562 type:complete len:210 (-) Transcript_71357:683-1312(-)